MREVSARVAAMLSFDDCHEHRGTRRGSYKRCLYEAAGETSQVTMRGSLWAAARRTKDSSRIRAASYEQCQDEKEAGSANASLRRVRDAVNTEIAD